MFPSCPTPQLKKYITLKGLPNNKFLRSKIRQTYLGEFEVEFKKALGRESGAQGGII
jgi:hypothetical protein